MRILYLIDSLAGSGAEHSLLALAPQYAVRGASLEVAYLRNHTGIGPELRAAGANVVGLSGPGGRLGWIERTTRLVRAHRPDVIHTTLFDADIIGRVASTLAATPVVSSLVNVPYSRAQLEDPGLSPWKIQAARLVDAITARRVRRFHAITSHVAEVMSKRLRVARSKIDVVPRGRDPVALGSRSNDRRARARGHLGIDETMPLVLAAARQEFQKGLDVLLEAFPVVLAAQPRARLVVAGREGNQSAELRSAVRRLGLDGAVSFLGARDDVPDLLSAADVFAFPSRWEGLGSVLIEAMALEAPIVASDLPPVRDVVGGERGARLVEPERPARLAEAIIDVLAGPAEAAEAARRARARFLELYTIDRVADGMIAFYERALNGRRAPA